MRNHESCQECGGRMAVLDVLSEGYDLVCARCGERIQLLYTRPLDAPLTSYGT